MGKGCIMLESYKEAAQYLPPLERLAYYESLMDYSFFGKEPEGLSPMAMGLFVMARPNIDSSANRYAASVENGKKGGAPKGNQNAKKRQDENDLNNQRKQPKQPTEQPKQTDGTTREINQNNHDVDLDVDLDVDADVDAESESVHSRADKPPTPARKKHGSFGWVKLTEEEYSRLVADLGEQEAKRCIDYIDEAAQSTGNKNRWKDWNLVIRKCHRDGWGLSKSGPARSGTPIPNYGINGGTERWSL